MSEEKKAMKKQKSKARKIVEWILTGIFLVLFAVVGIAQIDGMVHKKDHYNQNIRFGYGTFVVETDSMAPEYAVKSAIITYLDDADKIYKDFENGETVDLTFYNVYAVSNEYTTPLENPELKKRIIADDPDDYPIVTHRVREIHVNENVKKGQGRYTFITSGINTRSTNLGWTEGQGDIVIDQYQAFTEKEILGRVVVRSAFLGGVFGFVSSIWGLLILLLIPAFYLIITSVIDIFKAYKEPDEASEAEKENNTSDKGVLNLSEEDKKRLKEELLEEMLNKKKGGQ